MAGQPRFKVPPTDQRDCSLYFIDVLDPRTNYTTVTLGYIGETARAPFTRFIEHLYDQPFGDTIVGKPRLDPRVFPGKEAVYVAEQAAVEQLRPLYNYEFNLGNPDRIPIPVAQRQRAERDLARGVTPTTYAPTPERREARRPEPRRPRRPMSAWERRLRRRMRRLAWKAGGYVAVSLAAWVALAYYEVTQGWREGAMGGGGVAVGAALGLRWLRRRF